MCCSFLVYSRVIHMCVCVCVCVCVYLCCAQLLSHVQLFATPWTVDHQASLSMGILQAGILEWDATPSSRDLPTQGSNPTQAHCRWILCPRILELYMCVCIHILFQTLFNYRLLQAIEYSSLCYAVCPCLFYMQLCVFVNLKILIYSSPLSLW